MPRYTVTVTNSSIDVEAGDILQLKSSGAVIVKNDENVGDEAGLVVRGNLSSINFGEAKTLQVKSLKGTVILDIVKGL